MTETLLSVSNVQLFGRKVADLAVIDPDTAIAVQLSARAATDRRLDALHGHLEVDGVALAAGDKVLVKDQKPRTTNGIYTVAAANAPWARDQAQPAPGELVRVTEGDENRGLWKRRKSDDPNRFRFQRPKPGGRDRLGQNNQLERQLSEASFARIYGFSYDGAYYELPRPTLFLIHGEGEPATLSSQIVTTGGGGGNPMRVATERPGTRLRSASRPPISSSPTISASGPTTRRITQSGWTSRPACSSRFCSTHSLATAMA
jgi:hypothetical protein